MHGTDICLPMNSGINQFIRCPPIYAHGHGVSGYNPYPSVCHPMVRMQAHSFGPSQSPNLYLQSSNGQVRDRIESLEHQNHTLSTGSETGVQANERSLPDPKQLKIHFPDATSQLNQLKHVVKQLQGLLKSCDDFQDRNLLSHVQITSSLDRLLDSQDHLRRVQDQIQDSQHHVRVVHDRIRNLQEQVPLRISRLEEKVDIQTEEISKLLALHNQAQIGLMSGSTISEDPSERRRDDRTSLPSTKKRQRSDQTSSPQTQKRKSVQRKGRTKSLRSDTGTCRRSQRLARAGLECSYVG